MKILFHDDEAGDRIIFLCSGCNEAWPKPFCNNCNACEEYRACPDYEALWERAEAINDARREDALLK